MIPPRSELRAATLELFAKVGRDNVPRLASSFSFFAILSLAPLLVLAVSAAALIWGKGEAKDQLLAQALSFAGPQVRDYLAGVIESSQRGAEGAVATALGLIVTFYSASNLFLQLVDAINSIWDIKTEGPFVRTFIRTRVLAFLAVFLFGGLMLGWMVLDSVIVWLSHQTGHVAGLQTLSLATSLVALSVAFSITYHSLPRGRLRWGDVWLGGLVTGLGITVSKFLLTLYFSRISGVYGAAGGAVIVLLWVYYSSIIYFFGAEVTYVYAHRYGSLKGA